VAPTILDRAESFREQTKGMSRAQKIQWFGSKLGVDEWSLLRLLGYSPASIRRRTAKGATFTDLAEAKPDQTIWVSELFFDLFDRSGYDLAVLSERLNFVAKRTTPTGLEANGADDRAATQKPGQPTAALLRKIQLGGRDVILSLMEYLSAARMAGASPH
jgi:hypothetical protein